MSKQESKQASNQEIKQESRQQANQTSRQAGKEAIRQADKHAGNKQASKHSACNVDTDHWLPSIMTRFLI